MMALDQDSLQAAAMSAPPLMTPSSIAASAGTDPTLQEAVRLAGRTRWDKTPSPTDRGGNISPKKRGVNLGARLGEPGSPESLEETTDLGERLARGEKISIGEAGTLLRAQQKSGQAPSSISGSDHPPVSSSGVESAVATVTLEGLRPDYLDRVKRYMTSSELQKFMVRSLLGQAGIQPEKWRPDAYRQFRDTVRLIPRAFEEDEANLRKYVTGILHFGGARGEKQMAFFLSTLALFTNLAAFVNDEYEAYQTENATLDEAVPDLPDDTPFPEPVPEPPKKEKSKKHTGSK